MHTLQPLDYDRFFHIYNRGINGTDLFLNETDYKHFLRLYVKYINPVARTFAWVLMKNHFHYLVQILPVQEIEFMESNKGYENHKHIQGKKYNPTRQFSHLFNAYAKRHNIKYKRTGSLFERPFRRILITDETYIKNLIFYIHNNPVHHGFVNLMIDYPWSSYSEIITSDSSKFVANKALYFFNSLSEFIEYHSTTQANKNLRSLIHEIE